MTITPRPALAMCVIAARHVQNTDDRLTATKRSQHVFGELVDSTPPGHGCCVDQRLDGSELRYDAVDQVSSRCCGGQINMSNVDIERALAEGRCSRLGTFLIEVGEDNGGTSLCERSTYGNSNVAGATRDDSHAGFEWSRLFGHDNPSSSRRAL